MVDVPLADQLSLRLSLPPHASVERPLELDASAVPGASVLLVKAWSWTGSRLDVACVSGTAALWIDGLEGPLLDAAAAAVSRQLSLANLELSAVEPLDPGYRQRFEADGIRGVSLLGFHDGDALMCGVVCREVPPATSALRVAAPLEGEALRRRGDAPAIAGRQAASSGSSLDGSRNCSVEAVLVGALEPEPDDIAALLAVVDGYPGLTLASGVLLGVAIVALILSRRPRPAW